MQPPLHGSRRALRIVRTRSPRLMRAAARLMAASDPWLRLGINPGSCLKNIKTPYRELHAALRGGALEGLVLITMYGTFRGYIQALCVAPEARGSGLGALLMRRAEERIFGESPNVFLCVSSFNKEARRFYRRLGYRRAGLLKDFLAKGSDELLLRKTKGPLLPLKS